MPDEREIRVPHAIERFGKEARYRQIVGTLGTAFAGSGLVKSGEITDHDLGKISLGFNEISPLAFESQRAIDRDREVPHKLNDPSTFDNWEDIGGPQEHMDLVMKGGEILTRLIQSHLKLEEQAESQWQEESIHRLRQLNPYHVAAAGGLHDIGRFVTHVFYSNDLIGGSILNKLGVRKDIIKILPDERVMQVSPGQMYDEIKSLDPEAVIVRIADEFSKRAPGKNRTLRLEDSNPAAQDEWGKQYINRPSSGLASDNWFRRHIERHNSNAPEYFEALDLWCKEMTGKPISYYVEKLSDSLSTYLPHLSTKA